MRRFFDSRYAELRCRICKSSFCCKDCRRKHEEKAHSVDPDCHICFYGKISLSQAQTSSRLMQHLRLHHWPLHCVKCGKVYTTLGDIEMHGRICTGMSQQSNKTPCRQINEAEEYKSPETVGMVMGTSIAVTSTPMTDNPGIINVPDNITPVDSDRCQPAIEAPKSIKKVTFLTTPALEYIRKKRKKPESFLKTSLKNSIRLNDSFTAKSISEIEKSSTFVSANLSLGEESSAGSTKSERPNSKRLSRSMSETLWMSAINTSLELENLTDKPVPASTSRHISFEDSDAGYCKPVHDAGTSCNPSTQETGVWASMISAVKNVVRSFNKLQMPAPTVTALNTSLKRNRSVTDVDHDVEERILKRHKPSDVKCRPPIGTQWKQWAPKVDKSIQTDYYEEN